MVVCGGMNMSHGAEWEVVQTDLHGPSSDHLAWDSCSVCISFINPAPPSLEIYICGNFVFP